MASWMWAGTSSMVGGGALAGAALDRASLPTFVPPASRECHQYFGGSAEAMALVGINLRPFQSRFMVFLEQVDRSKAITKAPAGLQCRQDTGGRSRVAVAVNDLVELLT